MTPPPPGRTTALLAGIGALGAALVLLHVSAWGAGAPHARGEGVPAGTERGARCPIT